jgi:hypothetical protein
MAGKNPNHDPSLFFRIAGVTVAAAAAIGAILISNKGKDVDSEAALQHALRPTMTRTAGEILRFADKHPSLSEVKVGKRVVEVAVSADVTPDEALAEGGRPDRAALDVVMRRRPGSDEPDPDAVLSVAIDRTGHVNGDPDQEYQQLVVMHAPVDGGLGWEAWEHLAVSDGDRQGPPQLHIDTTGADDPAAAARAVAADAPGILRQAETDLRSVR